MAKKVNKRVDVKKAMKTKIMSQIHDSLQGLGYEVLDGEKFGFTSGTLVIRTEKCDIQIKPIVPKAGLDRYTELVEETE